MNQNDLITAISAKAELTKTDTRKFLSALAEVTQDALAKGLTVTVQGIGAFSAYERAARTGRNPTTGEAIQVPAKRMPKFKASGLLKDALK